MAEQKIVFTLDFGSEWIPKEYYPVPGIKAVPEWYKDMETSYAKNKIDTHEVKQSHTIKRCMPVLDAITAGYILKLHTDLFVKNTDGVLEFEWANDTHDTITFHSAFQLINYRNLNLPNGAPKLRNPWGIKTPKNYSCLFVPPLHRPASGIRILEGYVDTDLYTNSVQLPFLVDEGFTGTIPAGTPIAQVIPFKRDSFRMEFGGINERVENEGVHKLLRSTWINGYRHKFRASKDYL
jgi:hypothetical protein